MIRYQVRRHREFTDQWLVVDTVCLNDEIATAYGRSAADLVADALNRTAAGGGLTYDPNVSVVHVDEACRCLAKAVKSYDRKARDAKRALAQVRALLGMHQDIGFTNWVTQGRAGRR